MSFESLSELDAEEDSDSISISPSGSITDEFLTDIKEEKLGPTSPLIKSGKQEFLVLKQTNLPYGKSCQKLL
jgi:hypothetical protein